MITLSKQLKYYSLEDKDGNNLGVFLKDDTDGIWFYDPESGDMGLEASELREIADLLDKVNDENTSPAGTLRSETPSNN